MVSRLAELVGAVLIILVGFTAVCALTYDPANRSLSERGPVRHSALGVVNNALEDGYTAHLALAQFPLPMSASREGLKDELIRAVQQELALRGFEPGPADGMLRPETRQAIRDYQAQSGLDATGEPTANLLEHIRITRELGIAVGSPEQQDKRELVARVQRRLIDLGYEPGPVGGILTAATRQAIAAFEADRGLPATGELTPQVVQALGNAGNTTRF